MRIIQSAKKSGQIGSKKNVVGGQIAIKLKSPTLKPRAGAGVKKNKTAAGGLKGRIEKEITVKVENENLDITTTNITTATPTKAQPPATPSAHPTSPEHQKIAKNSIPSTIISRKPITTTTKKAQRKRTPLRIPQAPRRQSVRIMECTQRSGQENLIVGYTEALVARLGGQISAEVEVKEEISSILKPKSGTGIPKKGDQARRTVRGGKHLM
ncbi:hypothetical protein L873DRAFT_1789149 [Choiromyces venosus 120613-1]|uniref:Uncharacterized protein n=1 Tax=Choiromyces venosus 120613-1 TaxID=1336337 RepID=A0A3N4K2S9_9PEZI|nr:hypothetical protein L873DRAFT_1789149 [Choiromyces venosus 120613-1]